MSVSFSIHQLIPQGGTSASARLPDVLFLTGELAMPITKCPLGSCQCQSVEMTDTASACLCFLGMQVVKPGYAPLTPPKWNRHPRPAFGFRTPLPHLSGFLASDLPPGDPERTPDLPVLFGLPAL